MERPFNVRFGPDGAMYIVDYGVVEIDMSFQEQGHCVTTGAAGRS